MPPKVALMISPSTPTKSSLEQDNDDAWGPLMYWCTGCLEQDSYDACATNNFSTPFHCRHAYFLAIGDETSIDFMSLSLAEFVFKEQEFCIPVYNSNV